MIDKVKTACTGCNACYNKCPVDAIRMIPDAEGFERPVIDWEICTRCNLCEKVCPALGSSLRLDTFPPRVFAAWTRDEELRISSTSGGVFSELARQVLAQGGHVAAARYKQDHTVEHCLISKAEDLVYLKQSKYLQSEIGDTFRKIEVLLKRNETVLFCGTPCQAAGLLSYLGRTYDNLIVCDFVCRGNTSPGIYRMYLSDLEKQHGSEVETIQFKNKDIGWNQFCTFIRFKNGKTYLADRVRDPYMFGYLILGAYLRPCCYECRFKEERRVSDISLGDFWGIGKTRPHLDHNKGTSLVLLNTDKGVRLFKSIQEHLESEACTYEEALSGNYHILHSAKRPPGRERFFERLADKGSFSKTVMGYQRRSRWMGFLAKKTSWINFFVVFRR